MAHPQALLEALEYGQATGQLQHLPEPLQQEARHQGASASRLLWREVEEAAVRAQLQQLELALALPPGEVAATDADQISRRTALLRPKGDFVAHCLRPHLPAIRTLLSDGGELRKPSKLVLSGQQRGFRLPLTSPLAAAQQEHPRYKQNLMRARRMISRTVGISEEEAQEQFLSGSVPPPIQLPNHASLAKHEAWAVEQVEEWKRSGAVKEWPFEQPPHHVAPLGVVEESKLGELKRRLIWDGVVINCHTTYTRHWTYVGFCLRGKYHVFTVPAFGLALVPYWYTTLKQELYLPLRRRGIRLSSLIDDTAVFANGGSQGAALSLCLQLRYLGLMVDTEQMVFRVPDDKLGEFLEEAEAALQERAMTGRQVRRLAGKLVSFTLAVQGAPLLFRALFHAARPARRSPPIRELTPYSPV
ncbi:hypothetical protein CHLNCDRAFT_54750 [Chlorella variabilis]|uniref:Reverse transcriptase domain-containing protein n=1 Tax=Chlorella variabilis TaxID=554065 RepID=E1ZQA5_CHLVA|nr:hypothetical protein CHLNCDRAFT_54750 [Chlorella variabilis]EFN51989.1 hypothetical protein CHLNCDRAFT_54750 [Chlorella variabilis]|eukprot:XP_005844091.1 hypothetical protein CHLNCDRAFT_54750 [Chlorella variabilis]